MYPNRVVKMCILHTVLRVFPVIAGAILLAASLFAKAPSSEPGDAVLARETIGQCLIGYDEANDRSLVARYSLVATGSHEKILAAEGFAWITLSNTPAFDPNLLVYASPSEDTEKPTRVGEDYFPSVQQKLRELVRAAATQYASAGDDSASESRLLLALRCYGQSKEKCRQERLSGFQSYADSPFPLALVCTWDWLPHLVLPSQKDADGFNALATWLGTRPGRLWEVSHLLGCDYGRIGVRHQIKVDSASSASLSSEKQKILRLGAVAHGVAENCLANVTAFETTTDIRYFKVMRMYAAMRPLTSAGSANAQAACSYSVNSRYGEIIAVARVYRRAVQEVVSNWGNFRKIGIDSPVIGFSAQFESLDGEPIDAASTNLVQPTAFMMTFPEDRALFDSNTLSSNERALFEQIPPSPEALQQKYALINYTLLLIKQHLIQEIRCAESVVEKLNGDFKTYGVGASDLRAERNQLRSAVIEFVETARDLIAQIDLLTDRALAAVGVDTPSGLAMACLINATRSAPGRIDFASMQSTSQPILPAVNAESEHMLAHLVEIVTNRPK